MRGSWKLYSFTAKFHANVQALHGGTLEVTCEERLTPRGDCVVLTHSTHNPKVLEDVCSEGKTAYLVIVTRTGSFWVRGKCAPSEVGCSFVVRKSSSKAPRTLMINADKASVDMPRELVHKARLWGLRAFVTLAVNEGPVEYEQA